MAHVLAKGCDRLWANGSAGSLSQSLRLARYVLVFLELKRNLVGAEEVDPVISFSLFCFELVDTFL